MIQITFFRNSDGVFTGFESEGHAGFAEYGHDIVCAAVSVLVINTINSIENFTTDLFSMSEDEKSGRIEFQFQSDVSHDSKVLMNSFFLGIQGILREYNNDDYIRLILKEV